MCSARCGMRRNVRMRQKKTTRTHARKIGLSLLSTVTATCSENPSRLRTQNSSIVCTCANTSATLAVQDFAYIFHTLRITSTSQQHNNRPLDCAVTAFTNCPVPRDAETNVDHDWVHVRTPAASPVPGSSRSGGMPGTKWCPASVPSTPTSAWVLLLAASVDSGSKAPRKRPIAAGSHTDARAAVALHAAERAFRKERDQCAACWPSKKSRSRPTVGTVQNSNQ